VRVRSRKDSWPSRDRGRVVTWAVVAIGLLLLVFLHELGHFGVALAVGIKPRSFYIGFPPAVAKVHRNGIEYGVGIIPLGGLVRIPGMHRPASRDLETFMAAALREQPSLTGAVQRVRRPLDAADYDGAAAALPELRRQIEAADLSAAARRSAFRAVREVDEGTGPDAYWRAPTRKRIAVIVAGPLMNVIVAFILFFAVFATTHVQVDGTTVVKAVNASTPAKTIGLRSGDSIIAVDGHETPTFDDITGRIQASDGKPTSVTVLRNGKRLVLGPANTIQSSDGRWVLGFRPRTVDNHISYSFAESARHAGGYCWLTVTGTANAITGLFHAKERAQLSGPVGIVRASQQALKEGFSYYLQVLGFVSMSLALLNLLPFLPLDGGHILFSLIERIRRRAVAREVYERVSVIGFTLILFLTVIALHNDVGRVGPH
jgi:regulator of sigma E protease